MNNDHIQFVKGILDKHSMMKNPIEQFKSWYQDAQTSNIAEPFAFSLATVGNDGKPSNRIVYMRGIQAEGFVFYTNYKSKKGLQIGKNENVAATFYWREMERQIRIEGKVFKLEDTQSDKYFNERPEGSKVGAWASQQSMPIESREELESKFEVLSKEYFRKEIKRPSFWGGYLIKPELIEFWQGRENRLHDRIQYLLNDKMEWDIIRLQP